MYHVLDVSKMNKICKINKFRFENRANFDTTDVIKEYSGPTNFGMYFFITLCYKPEGRGIESR
jgi:hypothetical protein